MSSTTTQTNGHANGHTLISSSESPDEYNIHTSLCFEPKSMQWLNNITFTVSQDTGLIVKMEERASEDVQIQAGDKDLRGKVVIPGMVDAHTHIFLHAYAENPSVGQKRDESFVERIIRSTNHCRIGLLAGFTTYRDLGSESMLESDANVRDAINRGLMPGPRLYVATKPIASTASYEPKTENHIGGTCIPASADTADGPDELRKAVRRRLGFGADIIKVYVDYRRRIMRFPPKQQHPYISGIKFLPKNPNPDYVIFSEEELRAIKAEAEQSHAPVVAHCHTQEGVDMACKAGFTSIEHGSQVQDLTVMKKCDTIFVPTLALVEFVYPPKLAHCLKLVKEASRLGIRIAAGGDTGTFPHGENARELELLLKAGLSVEEVIQSATYRGWESCGGDRCGRDFGWFEVGVAADMIALDRDPRDDPHAFREVSFVMKDAKVWKENGQGVNMLDIGKPTENGHLRHFGLEP